MGTTKAINTISFFKGYGGIERGLELAGERVKSIASCEIEAYAIANLIAKMESGSLDAHPIWTNAKTFPGEQFLGKVDLFTGGFPCQPFSSAGNRSADEDPRHLWPACIRAIESFRPHRVFFENVEGLISAKLGGTQWTDKQGTPVLLHVLRELERRGYKATWGVFSASEAGAPHQRKRVFILGELADSNSDDARRDSRELYEEEAKEGIQQRNQDATPISTRQDGGIQELADSKTMLCNGIGDNTRQQFEHRSIPKLGDRSGERGIQELANSQYNGCTSSEEPGSLRQKQEEGRMCESEGMGASRGSLQVSELANSDCDGHGFRETDGSSSEIKARSNTQKQWTTNTSTTESSSVHLNDYRRDGSRANSEQNGKKSQSSDTTGMVESSSNHKEGFSENREYSRDDNRTLVSQGGEWIQSSEHIGLGDCKRVHHEGQEHHKENGRAHLNRMGESEELANSDCLNVSGCTGESSGGERQGILNSESRDGSQVRSETERCSGLCRAEELADSDCRDDEARIKQSRVCSESIEEWSSDNANCTSEPRGAEELANSESQQDRRNTLVREEQKQSESTSESNRERDEELANSICEGLQGQPGDINNGTQGIRQNQLNNASSSIHGRRHTWPTRPGQPQGAMEEPRVKPRLGRTTDGINHRVDRLRILGNGVVPQTAAIAWIELNKRLKEL